MAVTTGAEYDHITISDGTDQTVHYLKDAAARTNLGDIKNASGIYDGLTNLGEYTLSVSDIEQGQWSYTAKADSTTRVRSKVLIPVRSGMTVSYSNTTLDTYFNVWGTDVPSGSSQTPVQSIGWKTDGSGAFTISANGYMSFIVRNHSNTSAAVSPADYNSVVTIRTIQKGATDLTSKIVDDYIGKPVIRFTYQGGISGITGNYYSASNRVATEKYVFPAGVYSIKAPDGYKLWMYKGELYGEGSIINQIFDSNGVEQIAFVLGKLDDSALSPADVKMMFLDTYTAGEIIGKELNGVTLAKVDEPMTGIHFNAINIAKSSKIYKMPKSGINLEQINVDVETTPVHTCMFYRMSNGTFVPATDYEYSGILWDGNTPTFFRTRNSLYYPYDDNLYYSVLPATDATSFADDLYVSYGTVRNGNGRLTNLAPVTIASGVNPSPNESITGPYPSFRQYADGSYTTQQYLFGTVIRLQDAKSVCCSADLSLMCWWYSEDGTLLGSVYGTALTRGKLTGINYIDLSQYGTNGYCVVVIRSPFTVKQPEEGATVTQLDEQSMGGLLLYDYVLDNVYAQYYNHVEIVRDAGLNPKVAHNIRKFKTLNLGSTYAFTYRGPVTSGGFEMEPMKHISPYYYQSTYRGGKFLVDVSMKSYVTALKNPNSCIYLGGTNTNLRYNGYGLTCGGLPPVLHGFEWAGSNIFIPGSDPSTNEDYEYITNWNYENDPDLPQVGDWMIGQQMDDHDDPNVKEHDLHVVLITAKIYIDGALIAYEGIESFPPYVKYRYIYVDDMLFRFNEEFSRHEPLGSYFNRIARLKDYANVKTLEDAYGTLSTNYTVSGLMCDRGTDGVYGIGQTHVYITIADTTITSFDIYKDGTYKQEYTLPAESERITFTDTNVGDTPYKAVDIAETIRELGAGYYELKRHGESVVLESFAVGEMKSVSYTESGDNYIITMEDVDDVAYVHAVYNRDDYGTTSRRSYLCFTKDMLVNNTLTVPKYDNTWNDGHTYTFLHAVVHYYAKHGTAKLGTYYVLNNVLSGSAASRKVYVSSENSIGVAYDP